MVSWNSNGIVHNPGRVFGELFPSNPDVVLLQEAHVLPKQLNRVQLPDGWAAVFTGKPVGKGKGVAVLVRSAILPPRGILRVVLDVSNAFLDAVAVEIRGYLFVSVYVHVNVPGPAAERYTALHEALSTLDHRSGPVIVGGDFNHPSSSQDLITTMSALGFVAVCDSSQATHERGGKLDWVFTRACTERPQVCIRKMVKDHHMHVFDLRHPEPLPAPPPLPKYGRLAKMSDGEVAEFHKGLSEVVVEADSDLTSIRDAITPYCAEALGVRANLRRPPKAWWNRDIEEKRRVYHRACRIHRVRQCPTSLQRLREAKSEYEKEIRRSKLQAAKDGVQKVRMGLAPIHILTRGKRSVSHQKLTVREPERFHNFWKSVFHDDDPLPAPPLPTPQDQAPCPPAQSDPPEIWYSNMQAALKKVSDSLFTADDVKEAITSLKNRAPGEDGIPVSIFKGQFKSEGEVVRVVDLYAETLAEVFNYGVQLGLPIWTKQGLGRWLYKGKGPVDDPDNYRLIVLQPILMKILERMVDLRLRQLIDKGEIEISVEQGGFMTHRSTYDSIFLLQSLKDGARARKQSLYTAFLDVKKAFDSVSHQRLLRVAASQGVPPLWIGVIHKLLVDRCTFLGDMEVPIQRGTPQGSPLSPLLFILFMEPLIARLRAQAVGVELSPGTFIRCLLFADDICLTASSLEDLQRMLNVCSDWAKEAAMIFNTKKSHLLHLWGAPYDPNVALVLSGEPLTWKPQVTYLGVPVKNNRSRSNSLPLELPRAWAALHQAGLALNPHAPVPLDAQLKLINSDVLAGVMYPAAVHDLEYHQIDVFVNTLLRRLIGCASGSSATFLRCELGLLPSKFLGHRRMLQYWRHVTNEAWFARLLPTFFGQGPLRRLRNVASLYGLELTTEVSLGVTYPIPGDSWQARVREVVDDAAVKHLQAEAQASERRFPGPEVSRRRNQSLKLIARPYVCEGGELAKYGVVFRQCVEVGRFQSWDLRSLKPCQYCQCESKFGDLAHLLSCDGVPQAFADMRHTLLDRVLGSAPRQDSARLLSDVLVQGASRSVMPALRLVAQSPRDGGWVLGSRWKKGKAVKAVVKEDSLRPVLALLKVAFKLAAREF